MKLSITWVQGLIVLLFVVVVYLILTRIFGHSATDLAITLGLFTLLLSQQYRLNRELGELKVAVKYGFGKVKEDMDIIKKKLKV